MNRTAPAGTSRDLSYIPFRPLTFGEMLGAAFKIVARNWAALVAVPAVVFTTFLVAVVVVFGVFGHILGKMIVAGSVTTSAFAGVVAGGSSLGAVALALVFLPAFCFTSAWVITIIDKTIRGERVRLVDVFALAKSRVRKLVGLACIFVAFGACEQAVLYGASLAGPAAYLILRVLTTVASFVLLFTFSFAGIVLLREERDTGESLKRSWALVKGSWQLLLGFYALIAVVSAVGGGLLGLIAGATGILGFGIAGWWIVFALGIPALTAPLVPYFAALNVLIYTDTRIRQERYDVELSAAWAQNTRAARREAERPTPQNVSERPAPQNIAERPAPQNIYRAQAPVNQVSDQQYRGVTKTIIQTPPRSGGGSKLPLIGGTAILLTGIIGAIAFFGFGGSSRDKSSVPIASIGPSSKSAVGGRSTPAMLNAPREFVNVALWPFDSPGAADRWVLQSQHSEAWQYDAAQTALRFAGEYLGFTEIAQVVHVTDKGDHAWVQVGYLHPGGREAVAANIHLQRIGSAVLAPWEVVGTEDKNLTLDTPAYGSNLGGRTITVGGMITGVDDCIAVRVLQDGRTLGQAPCVMAGGNASPWTNQVTIEDPRPGALTVVASTGGHVASVEMFAITGLRVG